MAMGSCIDMQAQFNMANGTVDNVCGQLFRDDGGTGNYTGTNLEMTICPDTPGDFVSAYFVAFNVFQTAIPNQSAQLTIYDGNSTAETSLGSYTGNDLQGLTVWSTPGNTSGCLTFVFTSPNPATTAGWEAEIICGTPCAPPTAAASFVASPDEILDVNNTPTLQICTGESITVEDNGSFVNGFPIEQWTWDFGDSPEETFVDGNAITHQYDVPGAYTVALTVAYDNGTDLCSSLNIDPLQVFVSTPPIFNTEIQSPICAGSATVDLALDGSPVISELWTDAPDFDAPSISPTGFDAGFSYCSELNFDFFAADATLENCEDLISITADMEHSYLGDLEINVTCPNGQSVLLQEQAGGGTFLGEAVDVENDLTEGNCYQYGWSETSTLGQIEDGANASSVTYVDALGNNVTANIANPGIYQLDAGNTLCDLVGCPLNGTWEFCFTDLLGADNGFVCTWNLNVDPNLLPGVTVIQPEIVVADWDFTAYADGSDLLITPSTTVDYGLDVEAVTPGNYPLTFYVENDFGCSADTTVFLEVIDNPGTDLTVGADQIWCNAPLQLDASLGTNTVTPTCGNDAGSNTYCYQNNDLVTYTYCPDNIGDGTAMKIEFIQGFLETNWDDIFVYDGEDDTAPLLASLTGDVSGQTFEACNAGGCLTIVIDADGSNSCADNAYDELQWDVTCVAQGSQCGFDWAWTPDLNLTNADTPNPTLDAFDGTETEFVVEVEPEGFDNCAATGTITVSPAFEFGTSKQDPSCQGDDGVIVVDLITPASDPQGPFEAMLEFADPITGVLTMVADTTWVSNGVFGRYNLIPGDYTMTIQNGNGCEYEQNFNLPAPVDLTLNTPPNQVICLGGTATLEVSSDQDPLNVWTYVWDNGLPNGPEQQVSPTQSTGYTVEGFDLNGCPTGEYVVGVNVLSAINADLIAPGLICSGEEVYLDAASSNGGSGMGYTYAWAFEGNVLNESDASIWTFPPSSGTYCVTVNDDCETPAATSCTEVVIESPVDITFSVDTLEDCGQGEFIFTNLTDPALIQSTLSLWDFGDGTFGGDATIDKAYSQPGFYDVALTVTSQAGNCEYTLVEEACIDVYPTPDVGYFAGPQPTRAPDTEITFDGYSTANVVEWFWTFNTFNPLGYSDEQDPVFEFPVTEGGIYPVQLRITDSNGCTNVVNRQIEIQSMFNLFIPTSFTPNNDGYNDAFFVEGTDIDPDRFEFEIWNRWGELIWSTTDPTDAWYGQVGEDGQHYVPNGPYSYRIEVHSIEDESFRKEVFGVVTIIR